MTPGSDEIGLLALGGFLPTGYYKDESKSAATFRVLNGTRWSIPGDFARVETDGTIVLLGRGSVCINSGGEKIFPEEVEEAVKLHPAVADCLVVGVPDDRFGEAVTAVVALRPGDDAIGRRDHRRARRAGALQAPARVRVRARGAARPERQGRLPLGEGHRAQVGEQLSHEPPAVPPVRAPDAERAAHRAARSTHDPAGFVTSSSWRPCRRPWRARRAS